MSDKIDDAIKFVSLGGSNRSEKLELSIDIDKKGYDKYKKNLDLMMKSNPDIREGDTLKFSYTIMVEYFGDIAANLKTIIKLREDGYKVGIGIEEINHGKCLIQEVLCHLDTIGNQ